MNTLHSPDPMGRCFRCGQIVDTTDLRGCTAEPVHKSPREIELEALNTQIAETSLRNTQERDDLEVKLQDHRVEADKMVAALRVENARMQMEIDASCNAEELRQVRTHNTALRAQLAWLQENAPLALWRGNLRDGTPVFDILETDLDGHSTERKRGTGTDLASAIADARKQEARP